MFPSSDRHDDKMRAAVAAVEQSISRFLPADKSDPERSETVTSLPDLGEQLERAERLNEYCDEAVAAIRASLKRPSSGGG